MRKKKNFLNGSLPDNSTIKVLKKKCSTIHKIDYNQLCLVKIDVLRQKTEAKYHTSDLLKPPTITSV